MTSVGVNMAPLFLESTKIPERKWKIYEQSKEPVFIFHIHITENLNCTNAHCLKKITIQKSCRYINFLLAEYVT